MTVIYGEFSNVASATTQSAAVLPVAGAAFSIVIEGGDVAGGDFGVDTPPSDGARIHSIIDAGYTAVTWASNDPETSQPLGPKFRSSGIHQINSRDAMEMDTLAIGFNGTPLEPNGQQAWSFSTLLRGVTPIAGRGTLLLTTDSPSLELYLDSGTSVGFSNDGSDVNVAAAVSGVQVLIWTFEPGVGVKVYRNTGSGLAQIGSTSVDVDATGYEFFNLCYFMSGSGGSDKVTTMDVAEFWGHPFLFTAPQLAAQAAYLAANGGI